MIFIRFFIVFLLFIWQIPQTLLAGLQLFFIYASKRISRVEKYKNSLIFYFKDFKDVSSVSFGMVIFIWDEINKEELNDVIRHEYGHSIQSLFFGPLYFLYISINLNVK